MSDPFEYDIRDLHQFFAEWFRGECEQSEEIFSRVTDGVAHDFTLVGPLGAGIDRRTLLQKFYERHGALPDYRHEILDVTPRYHLGEVAVYSYIIREIDEIRGDNTLAVSVVLRQNEDAPNGVEHLIAHESFLRSPQ